MRLALEPAPGNFFDVVHEGEVTAQGAVALSVSCRKILDRDAVHAYQAVEGLAFTSNVTLHSDESMTEANFGSAVRQLDEIARGFNDAKDRLDMKNTADSDVPRIDFATDDDRSTLSVCSLACSLSSS